MKKDLVSLKGLTQEKMNQLFQEADRLKRGKHQPLAHQTLALIFEKPSMRTRVSFEVGMFQLGGAAIYLRPEDIQLGVRETVSDTAHVLSRYVDGIVARTFHHRDIETLSHHATIPVINGLSDREHPCQALADLYTVRGVYGELRGLKMAYIGDGNNVLHSLLHGASLMGMHVGIATPKGYAPLSAVVREAKAMGKRFRSDIALSHDPKEAVRDADVVYTDVWTSMGQEKEKAKRLKAFQGFQVNEKLMKLAKPKAKFMHCLPAHRGEEVSKEILEGKRSIVWDQAENRLHIQKAILVTLMGKK